MRISYARFLLSLSVSLTLLLVIAMSVAHAAPLPQGTDATLRIINESEQTICHVFISPVTTSEWGDDWLGENETIPSGTMATFSLAEGDYDVLLADCGENVLLDERDVTISGLHELRFTDPDLCSAMNQEGITFYWQAKYGEAMQQFQDALACYREAGDRAGEGATLNNHRGDLSKSGAVPGGAGLLRAGPGHHSGDWRPRGRRGHAQQHRVDLR